MHRHQNITGVTSFNSLPVRLFSNILCRSVCQAGLQAHLQCSTARHCLSASAHVMQLEFNCIQTQCHKFFCHYRTSKQYSVDPIAFASVTKGGVDECTNLGTCHRSVLAGRSGTFTPVRIKWHSQSIWYCSMLESWYSACKSMWQLKVSYVFYKFCTICR